MRTRLAIFVFVLAAIYFLWRTFLPALTTMTHSYPAYYTASRLVIEGRWSAELYDDKWFEARVLEMTQGRVSDHFSLHPPTTSLLLVPIAWLDLTSARVVWQCFNLALLGAAMWLLVRALKISDTATRLLIFSFALVYPPLAENIRVGQTYVLILFLFAFAMWGQVRENHFVAGIGLGIAAGIKLSGAPIWLLLAVREQWRTLFFATLTALFTALLGLVLGLEGWFALLKRVVDYSQPVPLVAHVAFQTTPSFLQRLFVASSEFNPAPLFDAPSLAPILSVLILVTAFGVMLWYVRRAPFELAFALAVTSGVILFPMATEYHYTLLLIPLAMMSAQIFDTRKRVDVIWLTIILFLLCVSFDWNAPRWSTREFMLLAYPRLYAGWLVWLWLLIQTRQPRPAARANLRSNATR